MALTPLSPLPSPPLQNPKDDLSMILAFPGDVDPEDCCPTLTSKMTPVQSNEDVTPVMPNVLKVLHFTCKTASLVVVPCSL
jgi:hypothetical protein